MQIQPASHPSVHTATPAAAHPAPARSFASHVDEKKRASARSTSASKATSPASAEKAPTTASEGTTATAPAAGSSASTPTASTPTEGSVQSSVDQSDDDNMQFLQMQEQVDNQSEMFTTMSNVEKTQTDTLKNTAQNMAI